MNSKLQLKEKNENRVIYRYSSDVANFENYDAVICDGEIEINFVEKSIQILKTATFDDDGIYGRWLYNHVVGVVFSENCPQVRFIAIG